jgi:hypothetical protein
MWKGVRSSFLTDSPVRSYRLHQPLAQNRKKQTWPDLFESAILIHFTMWPPGAMNKKMAIPQKSLCHPEQSERSEADHFGHIVSSRPKGEIFRGGLGSQDFSLRSKWQLFRRLLRYCKKCIQKQRRRRKVTWIPWIGHPPIRGKDSEPWMNIVFEP